MVSHRRAMAASTLAVLFCLLGAIGLCAGCSLLGDSVEVDILLPDPPPQWEPIFRAEESPSFLVRAPGRGRLPQELLVSAPARGCGEPACRLALPKRANLPILAVPLIQGRTDLLRPAGGFFPSGLGEDGRLTLTWREGFLASLLLSLAERGSLIEAVNARRLGEEIARRCGGDPWSLDREAILTHLALGSFRADRIKQLAARPLVLHAAPESRWVEGDPFRPELQADPLGALRLEGVTPGFHAYFRVDAAAASKAVANPEAAGVAAAGLPDGAGGSEAAANPEAAAVAAALERLDLSVSDEGWIARDAATGAAESGRW